MASSIRAGHSWRWGSNDTRYSLHGATRGGAAPRGPKAPRPVWGQLRRTRSPEGKAVCSRGRAHSDVRLHVHICVSMQIYGPPAASAFSTGREDAQPPDASRRACSTPPAPRSFDRSAPSGGDARWKSSVCEVRAREHAHVFERQVPPRENPYSNEKQHVRCARAAQC